MHACVAKTAAVEHGKTCTGLRLDIGPFLQQHQSTRCQPATGGRRTQGQVSQAPAIGRIGEHEIERPQRTDAAERRGIPGGRPECFQ